MQVCGSIYLITEFERLKSNEAYQEKIDCTDLLHLVILNNLQNTNAELIEEKIPQNQRLIRLNKMAKRQMEILKDNRNIKELETLQKQVRDDKLLISDENQIFF